MRTHKSKNPYAQQFELCAAKWREDILTINKNTLCQLSARPSAVHTHTAENLLDYLNNFAYLHEFECLLSSASGPCRLPPMLPAKDHRTIFVLKTLPLFMILCVCLVAVIFCRVTALTKWSENSMRYDAAADCSSFQPHSHVCWNHLHSGNNIIHKILFYVMHTFGSQFLFTQSSWFCPEWLHILPLALRIRSTLVPKSLFCFFRTVFFLFYLLRCLSLFSDICTNDKEKKSFGNVEWVIQ